MRHSIRVLAMIIPLLIAACQRDLSATIFRPTVMEEPTQGSISLIESPEKPTLDTANTPEVETLPDVIFKPRQDLEATDPSTIVLASGKPTLVEFFAFW